MRIFLAAKTLVVGSGLMLAIASMPAWAGIPTFDATNIVQTTLSAQQAISQTQKQIQQYQTQLQQYQSAIRNSAQPDNFTWSQAQQTIGKLTDAMDTLNYYRQQTGSVDAYLRKFRDQDYYRDSPCFSGQGCTQTQRNKLEKARRLGSSSRKKANDAMMHGLEQQEASLKNDASRLQTLQTNAQGAQGRMAAIQYANQLAAQQNGQLMQLRGLLIAQQQAAAARNMDDANRDATEQAAAESLRKGDVNGQCCDKW